MSISPEEKLLRLLLKDGMKRGQGAVRQGKIVCRHCHLAIDIADLTLKVDYLEVKIGGRVFTFAEPYCPKCNKKVKAEVYTNN